MTAALIRVEVIAGDSGQQPVSLQLPAGTTLAQAIEISGLVAREQLVGLQGRVGIFGRLCELSQVLVEGDRIEIYRPLLADPKDARRGRVAKRRKAERSGRA